MIFWACYLAYLLLTLVTARRRYQRVRPYTEPLACQYASDDHKHKPRCYRRWSDVDTVNQAVFFALIIGLAWPFVLPGMTVRWFVTGGARPLPEETRAQIRQLETENEQLKRQQQQ